MSDKPTKKAKPFSKCEPGTDKGQYITSDGLPRVWDGSKWLSPKDALECGVIEKEAIKEDLSEEDLGHLKTYGGSSCLYKIPGFFVLDLVDSEYSRGQDKPLFFDDLEKAKAEFWKAIKKAVASGSVNLDDIGRMVHYRSVYSEDGCGENWETASVYDCPGFAVIDYGSFPDTCDVPRFEISTDVTSAKYEAESFVDELEMNAQDNIEYEWKVAVWNEGEEEVTFRRSWQEENDDEEDEGETDGEEDPDEEDDVSPRSKVTSASNTGPSHMRIFFSNQYLSSGHEFDTTRKAGWIVDSLADGPITVVEIVEPTPLSPEDLAFVHDAAYVQAVQTGEPRYLAQSQGFTWDPGLFPAVSASNGGMVAAALDALQHGISGSLSSGLHHARKDSGSGYCTFNGLVLAAHKALDAGAKSVLILDLDAHCGGGTASLIDGLAGIRQVDISVSRFDDYDGITNSVLEMVDMAEGYIPFIQHHLEQIMLNPPDLVIYNAGMDPFEDCMTGGLAGINFEMLRERERLVFITFRKQGVPIAFALAGGYVGCNLSQEKLVDLHRLTIEAAISTVSAMPSKESAPS